VFSLNLKCRSSHVLFSFFPRISLVDFDSLIIKPPQKITGIDVSNSIEQSPSWKAESHSASKEVLRLLWNPKVHYRIYNNVSLVPILSHMNPVHSFPPYFPKIHSNIIFLSTPRSCKWFLPSGFSTKILYKFLISHACYVSRPSQPPRLYHPNNIWWSVQVMELLNYQSSPASHHFLPLMARYFPQVPVL